ncbi:MAG TPA: DUF255 domain-containing protein [Fimbriimonas sp.]|nr:DUF255 domain-containing protein [Fimbriimonas sp.]
MYRPGFNVVTGVVTVLCVLAFIANLLRPHLPPAATNQLNLSQEDFLRRAAHQAIDWQELDSSAIQRARSQGKPILLLIGVVSSGLGQRLDATAFRDEDVARLLNGQFVPVRVDGLQHPEWINAFFPISRLKMEFLPGTQIWVITPDGRLADFIGKTGTDQSFDPTAMYRLLLDARQKCDEIMSGHRVATADLIQHNDIANLSSQTGGAISPFEQFRAVLQDTIDPVRGGLPNKGIHQLFPNALRFLCLDGDLDAVHASLDPMLMSPMMDVLDGGFFRVSNSLDYQQIEFNKVATEQAEMLWMLAIAYGLTKDPLYAFAAANTNRALTVSMRAGEWVAASQTEEPYGKRRSDRYSFSVAKLREILPPTERTWARENLGLDVLRNQQMVAHLSNRKVVGSPELRTVLDRLRTHTSGKGSLSGIGFLEIEATVAARRIQAGRILGNARWKSSAISSVERLRRFKTESGLVRRLGSDDSSPAYLGDHLAYADAFLQDYLATGRIPSLEEGYRILQEVPARFKGDRSGEYRLTEVPLIFANTGLPEIADNFRESCTARIIRLFQSYGRLFADTDQGRKLMKLAEEASGHFALFAGEGGPTAGGFFCSAAEVADPVYAIAVGAHSQDFADRLIKAVPTRFVAAAHGSVRRDLQARPAGIYIVGEDVSGPFTLEEAARRLPKRLSLPTFQ